MRRIATRIAGAAAATALAITGSLLLASPAQAAGTWGEMVANSSLYLTPNHSTPRGYAYNGDTVLVTCWTTGEYNAGGQWPSNIWDNVVDDNTGSAGLAPDTYVWTNGDVRNLVRHC